MAKKETNAYLTELRTVRSRAKTALTNIEGYPREYEKYKDREWFQDYKPTDDHENMVAALELVVAILERWA